MRFMNPTGMLNGHRIGRLPCPTRDEVRDAVACPTCGARVGEECHEGAASRDSNHIARVKTAIAEAKR